MLFKTIPLSGAVLAGVLAASPLAVAQSPLEESVNTLQQWVETERLIADSRAAWETEKAALQNLIAVYREELASLDQTIADAEKDTSAAESRRAELLEQDEQVKAIENRASQALAEAEKQVKTLQAVLPPPLQQELLPLFSAIPQDPDSTKLAIGQRIQPLVAILTQVQKFNQAVTLVEDFREFEAGRTVQTETVYFGLAAAYYVDRGNNHAGVGKPGPGGWIWQANDSYVQAVRNFIEIYRGTQQARYIELPVSLN